MSVLLFLMMPAVLVIGTLVLICRKMIYRTFISKCKEELPDYFDPESLIMGKFFDGHATHHQYHDLRQRSSTASHFDTFVPPFHQLQHDGTNSISQSQYNVPSGGAGQGQGQGLSNSPHFYAHANTQQQNQSHNAMQAVGNNPTTILPRPCTKLKGGRDRVGVPLPMDVSSNSSSNSSSSGNNNTGATIGMTASGVIHRGAGVGGGFSVLSSKSRSSDTGDNSNSSSSNDNTPRLRDGSFYGVTQRVSSPRDVKNLASTRNSPPQNYRQFHSTQHQQRQYQHTRHTDNILFCSPKLHLHLNPSSHHVNSIDREVREDVERDQDRERDAEEGLHIATANQISHSVASAPVPSLLPHSREVIWRDESLQLSKSASNSHSYMNNGGEESDSDGSHGNSNSGVVRVETHLVDIDDTDLQCSRDGLDTKITAITSTHDQNQNQDQNQQIGLMINTNLDEENNQETRFGSVRTGSLSSAHSHLSPLNSKSFDCCDANTSQLSVLHGGQY